MRFYTQQHQYYCGIDLHARSIYLCIIDQSGKILLHRNMRANPGTVFEMKSERRCWKTNRTTGIKKTRVV